MGFAPWLRAWPTAPLLAENRLGEGFVEASCCLGDERTGDFLRVFEDVERGDLAPPQRDHVNGVLRVAAAVQQRRGAVPLHEHHRVPRPAFDPDLLDLETEIGQDARETLEPAAQRFPVVALTTDGVDAAEAVMDVWGDRSHQFVPAMVVDVLEGLSDFPLDDCLVQHRSSLQFGRVGQLTALSRAVDRVTCLRAMSAAKPTASSSTWRPTKWPSKVSRARTPRTGGRSGVRESGRARSAGPGLQGR